MLRPKVYFLLFLLPLRMCAQQQSYLFHHLTAKDGLASEFVQSIFQDSKGFYWVGTTSGLQKFDAYNFSKPLNAGNDVMPSPNVIETKDGTLWISAGTSLYRYNRYTEQFVAVVPGEEKPKLPLKVIEDSLGNIWLLSDQFLYKYDAAGGKLVEWLKLPPSDHIVTAAAIGFSKETNVIWIQRGTGIYKIVPFRKSIIKQVTLPYPAVNLWADGSSYLWISSWTEKLCRYHITTGKKDWFRMLFKNNGRGITHFAVASCYARDGSGRLWIGSIDGGLWCFDETMNKVLQLSTDNVKPESFHSNENVYSITVDKAGSMWIGSDRGINIFNPSYQRFHTLNNTDLPTKGIPSFISQKPFETSTGDILISTDYGGWLHYDSNFKLKRSFAVILNSHSSETDKYKTVVTCFAEDKTGRIWVGHRGGLLGIYEPRTGVIRYTTVPEFKKNKITGIQCDIAGNMWFSFRFGSRLIKWDVNINRYKIYDDSLLMNRGQEQTMSMMTKSGDLWMRTFGNGIYRFDPVSEKIAEIYREEQPPCNIPNVIHAIAELNDSIIGIASYEKGFFLFNRRKKTAVPLNTSDGLPSDIGRAIATDAENNFWLATLSDLVRMNPVTKKIVSFDEEDGVLNKSFAYGFTKLRNGTLMMTTNTGLLYFHPDSIKVQPPPPDVLITGLKIMNQPVLLDSILKDNNKLRLSYDKNFLSIDYVSISYLNRKTTQYFYKLEGLEKEWVGAGTQRFATYTNLSPGTYTFMVCCQNRDGVFSKNITYLTIVISPPWWRTWWSYVLYGFLFSAAIYYLYQNRIRSLEKKQQAAIKAMVATQEEERKRISRDLHDDVGTKLSALKLFLSSLHEKATGNSNKEIKSLAESSEQFITEAMQDVRRLLLNLSPGVLEEFGYTIAVEALVNKINKTKKIYFSLVVFGMKQRLQKDYELALYRISQELINNVLKHAEARNVFLQIGQRDEKIILMIEDDGKGFDVNIHKDGYGLQNLSARTKLMQGTMIIDSKAGKGTSVLIEIPYNF